MTGGAGQRTVERRSGDLARLIIGAAGVAITGFWAQAATSADTSFFQVVNTLPDSLEGLFTAVDALGSMAVVVSGAVILATGWQAIDPLASIAIAVLILASSIRLVREPLDVLMEAAPPGIDVDAVARAVGSVPGVREVHELHVWTVTPGFEALAAHVVVARGGDRDRARREVEFLLRDRYGIEHTTLQMEEEADDAALLQVQTEPRRG